jgi:hypothetical protein
MAAKLRTSRNELKPEKLIAKTLQKSKRIFQNNECQHVVHQHRLELIQNLNRKYNEQGQVPLLQ